MFVFLKRLFLKFGDKEMLTYFRIMVLMLSIGNASAQSDPCDSHVYQDLSDVTMKSDFKLQFGHQPLSKTPIVGWVRYTATGNGSLITECTVLAECGVYNQFWMNDSTPSIDDGETTVFVCGHGSTCCDKEMDIGAKNCSDYMVYKLKPVDNNVRYCFAADPITTHTRPTTTSSPTTTSNITYIEEGDASGGVNIVLIAAAIGAVVVVGIIIAIVCIVVRKKRFKRYVGNSGDADEDWQTLNIAAIYRTKRKDLLIPRSMYLSGKPSTNASMVYLNPRDEDYVDMREHEALPRTRSELDIFSPPEIKRLGIDISAVYQTHTADTFITNMKFSSKVKHGDHVISVFDVDEYLPYFNVDKIKFY